MGDPDDPAKVQRKRGLTAEKRTGQLAEKFDPLRLRTLLFWWRVWDSNPRPVLVFQHLTGNGF